MATRNPVSTITNRQSFNLFITAQDIKTFCPVAANVNDNEFFPAILSAQNLIIKDVLGTYLYDKLEAEWQLANYNPADLRDATQSPDAVDYKELYKQLYLPLVWHSFYRSLAHLAISITDKGIQLQKSDYSDNGGLDVLKELELRYRTEAGIYTEQLKTYITNTFKNDTNVDPGESGGYNSLFYFRYKPNECNR